jgi:large subunit ribosomal protein L15
MKLHDLRPAEGSRTPRTRVGRGIAAGKGKTAGRGTKGQKSRAGGSIPPWFEGGQTPLHVRIPKLRGFRNRFKIEYEIVNVGAIGAAVERGAFEAETPKAKGKAAKADAQITVNQDILRAVGLVRSLDKPLKILGGGELDTALFVVADAFTASARTKIEAAGGAVTVLEVPTKPLKAIGVDAPAREPSATEAAVEPASEEQAPADEAPAAVPPARGKSTKSSKAAARAEAPSADVVDADGAIAADEPAADNDAGAEVTASDGATAVAEPEAETATSDDAETDDAETTSGDDD